MSYLPTAGSKNNQTDIETISVVRYLILWIKLILTGVGKLN